MSATGPEIQIAQQDSQKKDFARRVMGTYDGNNENAARAHDPSSYGLHCTAFSVVRAGKL
jgi:hypothetical protein